MRASQSLHHGKRTVGSGRQGTRLAQRGDRRIQQRSAHRFRGIGLVALLTFGLAACGPDQPADDRAGAEDQPAEGTESGEDVAADGGDQEGDAEGGQGEEEARDEQAAAPELPGGGETVFPDRRMVALYGSPDTPALGVLGQNDIDEAVEYAQDYAEQYQEFSEEPVIPAWEIITTVASTEPGPEGLYTNELDPEIIEPWIEAAAEEDIYVVLDLQPGRKDFLSQAQEYEELLTHPHVGLALDPEWRITDDQVHLEQVGSVTAEEINETGEWLADLTEREGLPQKVFLIHQFEHQMIQNGEDIDTSREELAVVLHSDGHGTPEMKMETWDALQPDLPEDVWMAWKNFYDQDDPTFTPEETYDVEPKPWFVSYQ